MLAHPAKECISCNVCVCVYILFSLPLSPPPSLPPAQATKPTLEGWGATRRCRAALASPLTRDTSAARVRGG